MAARQSAPLLALASALLIGAAPPSTAPISPARIKEHVRVLSSDAFQGRGPTQVGETATINYLARQFQAAGLRPAGPNGSWFQEVPLLRFDRGPVSMSVAVGGTNVTLRAGQEVTVSAATAGRTRLARAPLVFGGYGVASEALGWDPFAGVDVRGKVVVVLWGDPDVEAGRDLGFGGRSATLAGRAGSKFAPLRARGAVGIIAVHEDFPASYPWSQLASSDAAPDYALDPGTAIPTGAELQAFMRRDVAATIFRRAGFDYVELKRRAQSRSFRAVPLGNAAVSVDFSATAARVISRNVVGVVPGTSRARETILYGAHWDAYGVNAFDPPRDRIRNGAVDNAVGTATLIEVARAFAQGPSPQRSVLFAGWTAEEKGLLGASWYAANPLRPLATTAAVLNLDPHVALGAARNLELIGVGRTPLEQDLKRVAAARGLRVDPEENTEAGWYFRSDHFAFAAKGVPTVYFRAGRDLVRGGKRAGTRIVERYNARCYHQICDEFDRRWDMVGPAQEGSVALDLGRELANSGRWPGWNPNSEYTRVREASAAERR